MSAKSQAAALVRTGDTKEKRAERMRAVARARWDKSTLAERQRSARVMNEARKKKYA
jgi:chorismate mutase